MRQLARPRRNSLRTAERAESLKAYADREILGSGKFVCRSGPECIASVGSGVNFWEGQLSHVGRHFDLTLDGAALRVMVVGKENGRGPARISMENRSSAVHDCGRMAFNDRNPHMRGTTLALRLLLTGELATDHDGEYLDAVGGDRFHMFDAFALVNRILCSAVEPPSTNGRSTPVMRRNCLRHFEATVAALEPTVIVLQGARLLSWIRPLVSHVIEIAPNLSRARVAGSDVLLALFTHPQARAPQSWSRPRDEYLLTVVRPALLAARNQLGLAGQEPTADRPTRPAAEEQSRERWTLVGADLDEYRRWISSVNLTSGSDELRIAFVLAHELGLHPTRTTRILRGQRGEKSDDVRQRVLAAVEDSPELEFGLDGRVRRVSFVVRQAQRGRTERPEGPVAIT